MVACKARTGFTARTMLTCTSPQLLTMLQLCTILHLLRITQRLLWKLTSVTVLQTTPWQTTHLAMVTTARPPVACYHRDARMQVTSDADKDSVLPQHMPFKRTRGILSNGSSCVLLVASDKSITLFTCKTRTLFLSSLHRHNLQELETGGSFRIFSCKNR